MTHKEWREGLCRDCYVEPGEPHTPGCDVARCKVCGWQDIGDHDPPSGKKCSKKRKSTIWTGRWPGLDEVAEYELTDLNELMYMCQADLLVWDGDLERWVRNPDARMGWDEFLTRQRKWEADRKSKSRQSRRLDDDLGMTTW